RRHHCPSAKRPCCGRSRRRGAERSHDGFRTPGGHPGPAACRSGAHQRGADGKCASMIDVKGTKETTGNTAAPECYAFPAGEQRSRVPAYVAMVFLGLLAYLRSAVPFFNPARPDEANAAGSEALEALHLEQVQESAGEDVSAAAGETSASVEPLTSDPYVADNVVPFPHRLVDSPALYFEIPDPPSWQEGWPDPASLHPGAGGVAEASFAA